MKAWLFQRPKHLQELGAKAPWSVGWYDHDGKRREKQIGNKTAADKFRVKKESELSNAASGSIKRGWKEFRQEYETQVLAGLSANTRVIYRRALDHFQRIIAPKSVDGISERTIDQYIAKRRATSSRLEGDSISPATINNELRTLKRVLRVAHRWKYLPDVPRIEFVREPEKLARFVTQDHFAAIYEACDVAVRPSGLPYPAADWWRALLVFQFMTGWRVSEPLKLMRSDVDMEHGTAITRHDTNKGKRDERVPLHPVLVEHLAQLKAFRRELFPWDHGRRGLWDEFQKIQRAAGIKLSCHRKHKHSDACGFYGFHDIRRAFATLNAGSLSASELQTLMRHRSYTTTQKYINMAAQMTGVTDRLTLPAGLDNRRRKPDSGGA